MPDTPHRHLARRTVLTAALALAGTGALTARSAVPAAAAATAAYDEP